MLCAKIIHLMIIDRDLVYRIENFQWLCLPCTNNKGRFKPFSKRSFRFHLV